MKRRLMEFVGCPECAGAPLELDIFRGEGAEVLEGMLLCQLCGRRYPVIAGVPRLLPDNLLGTLPLYHPEFFRQYDMPVPSGTDSSAIGRTLEFFTMQRPELHGAQLSSSFVQYLERNLDIRIPGARAFRGKVGLDAGCGEGRYASVLESYGAEVIGMDLGNSVDFAYQRNRAADQVHIVQGSIYQPPFRRSVFDFVMSVGVLHHLPDPRSGFRALVPLIRKGGSIEIWVYGLEDMSLTYRLSHLAPLRRLTSRLSPSDSYRLSVPLAIALEAFLFAPLRLLDRLPAVHNRTNPQLREVAQLPFSVKVAEVHDRLGAPVTYFLNASDLETWFAESSLDDIMIESTLGGRGWSARGTVPGRASSRPTPPSDNDGNIAS